MKTSLTQDSGSSRVIKGGTSLLTLLFLLLAVHMPTARANESNLLSRAPNKWTATEALDRIRNEQDEYFVNAAEYLAKNPLAMFSARPGSAAEAKLTRAADNCILTHGNRAYKEIALTFDDGPHARYTDQILEVLKQYDVPATFFVVGEQAEKFPALVEQEVLDGHLIANHTYHHVSLPKIPEGYAASEILACGNVIQAITGQRPRYFRPPGGEYNPDVAQASAALGYTMVLWTDDPGDYASPGAEVILKRTLDKARPGGIILLHDGIEQTVQILPELIESLRAQGYTFVRVDKMHRPRPSTTPEVPLKVKVATR